MSVPTDLLQWILHPRELLNHRSLREGSSLFWVVVVLLGLSTIAVSGYLHPIDLLFNFLFVTIFTFFVSFVQAVITDFCAQLFGKTSQSLVLFRWLIMAQLPLTLMMPFSLFGSTLPFLKSTSTLGILLCVGYSLWLQIQVFKSAYQISALKSIALLLAPIFFLVAIPIFLGFTGLLWNILGS